MLGFLRLFLKLAGSRLSVDITLCSHQELVGEVSTGSRLLFTDRTMLDCEQGCVPGTLDGVLTYASLLCTCRNSIILCVLSLSLILCGS